MIKKKLMTAQEVYRKLIRYYKIKSLDGVIKFQLGKIGVAIKRKDIIGGVIQEWLEAWLVQQGASFEPNPQSNTPPDIFLDPWDLTRGWLEVKAFNRDDTPRFSIAYFSTFMNELIERPWHLDTDYLIFGYVMDEETGVIKIKDLWLKKIWEITKPMNSWPLTVHFKNHSLNEIRPCKWFAERGSYKVFESVEDFLSAFEETLYQNPDTHRAAAQWRNKFCRSYKKYYGQEIIIPRWDHLKKKYL